MPSANNTVTATWRDLADQLTPEQVASQHAEERRIANLNPRLGEQFPDVLAELYADLLPAARRMIRENEAQVDLAHIAPPADCASTLSRWLEWDEGVWNRAYKSYRRSGAGVEVEVDCVQYSDGRPVDRFVYFADTDRGRENFTAARARVLAHFLIEAAERIEAAEAE